MGVIVGVTVGVTQYRNASGALKNSHEVEQSGGGGGLATPTPTEGTRGSANPNATPNTPMNGVPIQTPSSSAP
jgi:hypothetical protein